MKLIVTKKHVSLFIFLFVNFIFCAKYSSRITAYYLLLSIASTVCYFIIWYKKDAIQALFKRIKINYLTLVFVYFLVCCALFYLIPKETLHVDRWSVITTFWDYYFENKYVYFAQSFDKNYPVPMPFYFVGELGLFSFLGILLFVILFNKFYLNCNYIIPFVLISTSLFYVWEICSRSNLFLNGTLILFSIVFFFKNYNKSFYNTLVHGIIFGFLLSTRNVFIIPYIIAFIYAIRSEKIDIKNTFFIAIIALLAFVVTFVPFVWNHITDFKKMNPFTIQSNGLMPLKYSLFFILTSFFIAFKCKSQDDVYFFSGVLLFITIVFYFLYTINGCGFYNTFFNSVADISYFILCIPFCMYHFLILKNNQ